MLDFRQMINGDKQKYKVKTTTATNTQDNELTNEASFSANLNYEKNLNIGKILFFFRRASVYSRGHYF